MKRIYKGKTINVNGVQITVKQVLGFGDAQVRNTLTRIIRSSQGWLSQVIPLVNSNMDEQVASAFSTCFCRDPDSASISTVKSVLNTTLNSLRRPHGVKIRNDDDAYGYVSVKRNGRKHLINGMVFHDDQGAIHKMGEIHVDKGAVRTDPMMAAITYIHEATHRFANTDDFGDKGYFKDDGSTFEEPGLTWQQALINADSYAYFVLKTIQNKYHHVAI